MKSGHAAVGRTLLSAPEEDARSRGFNLIADKVEFWVEEFCRPSFCGLANQSGADNEI